MKDWIAPLRITYDDRADAAYVHLVPRIGPGAVARTVQVYGGDDPWIVNLDVDPDGRILGLEVLDARRRLPTALLDGPP